MGGLAGSGLGNRRNLASRSPRDSWDGKRDGGDLRAGNVRVGLSAEVPPQGGGRTPVPLSVLSDIPVDGDVCLCCSGTGMLSWRRWGCALAPARHEWCHVGNQFPGLGGNLQVPDPWPARSLYSTPASSRPTPAAWLLCPELGGAPLWHLLPLLPPWVPQMSP